ncbi:MAG TPA: ribosome maturation factor RimM [Blastocatellia bacterium]|nr:ribosome maturation factor RimM [Blastocatellia bacterium]
MNEVPESEFHSEEELIAIARIARPQGVRGEVIADLLTDFPERFAELETVRAVRPGGEICTLRLERAWLHKRRIVLKFAGYETVERADELRNVRVMIGREQLVRLPEDSYYDFDLTGCEVMTVTGRPVGRVTEVQRYGAAPLLRVQDQEREHLIPLAVDICIEIDTARKRIVVDPPEGLLEL